MNDSNLSPNKSPLTQKPLTIRGFQRSVTDYWRDPVRWSLSNKIPERLQRSLVFFVSIPPPCKQASGCKQKIPPSLRSGGILLRSVADSNRRTRFCRPMPSHSANRPCFPADVYPPAGGQPTNIFRLMAVHRPADNQTTRVQK